MPVKFRYKNFYIVFLTDIALIVLALYSAHLVRFDFGLPIEYSGLIRNFLPFVITTKITVFFFFDLYSGMWRYTSIADLLNVLKAVTISSLVIVAGILFSTRFVGFSRSVFIIDWCFTFLFVTCFRLGVRFYYEHAEENQSFVQTAFIFLNSLKKKRVSSKNLLIIGAGDCGEKIFREIRDNASIKYHVIGFLDDNQQKTGRKIHGVPVLGAINGIGDVVRRENVDEVLIAIPSASSEQMRRLLINCENTGVPFKTVPSYGELINGRVTINSIREVAYRDLLGRELIKLDTDKIGAYLKSQCVLVTGAGGSIGSELCRQICKFNPLKLILFERAESPLHAIELELLHRYSRLEIIPILGDIRDKNQTIRTFQQFEPQTVFHAAAYKHVPMLERQPWKAVDNNIAGTVNLVNAATRFNVDRFVFVSTDKAVRPTNIMGTSKRVSEILIQSQNGCDASKTRFMIVRFGNVVGSVGSVVPLFKKQIQNGGPVTVTHPEVTRYFMTIPEACQLILQAGAMGEGGEIFLLDMGTPIKIADMARDLIKLSGFEPDVDIEIEYIGLRPGEKLYEELITEGEGIVSTNHEKIMVLKGKECNLSLLNGDIQKLVTVAEEQDASRIITILKKIVPQYTPDSNGEKTDG